MYEKDHAPLGAVAFRCTPDDLLASALAIWGETAKAGNEGFAEELVNTAMWYEGLARTLSEIRCLPCCG